MKLGIVIPQFPSQTHAFFWRDICALRELGATVRVISTRRPPPCPHRFAAAAAAETHYLYPPRISSVLLAPASLHRLLPFAAALVDSSLPHKARVLALGACAVELARFSRTNGIDHLHVHSCANVAYVAAMSRAIGGPSFSLHLHGDLAVYGGDHRSKMRHAAFIAAAARPMQRQVVETVGVPDQRTLLLPMGVDTDRFRPGAQERRERGVAHAVTIARLNLTKGHMPVLRAMRDAIDRGAALRYSIAGDGPEQAEIADEIRRLRLEEHVRMLGSIGEDAVLALLQTADFFVLASFGIGEASPVAVMEAMACGVPAICTRIGGTPDMIDSVADGILVAQQDTSALAGAIYDLATRTELRARLGIAARERAQRSFDYRVSAKRLFEAIQAHAQNQ